MKKRIFSLFMVFTLCFVSVNEVYADAGSLIIAGGSVAGVTAGAIAGPAVVAVFCAMMAFGMNIELTEASEEAGMTKTEFLKNKIQQYCNEAQISANTFNNYILDQANVFQDGAISLTDRAGRMIQQFCNWLFESGEVQNVSGTTIFDYEYIFSETGNFMNGNIGYRTADNSQCYASQFKIAGTNYYMCVFFRDRSLGTFTINTYNAGWNDSFNSIELGDYFYNRISSGWAMSSDIQVPWIPYNGEIESVDALEDLFTVSTRTDSITGNQDIYDTSKGVLNPTIDKTIVINPNITIPVPVDKDVTIDVNEYIDIIQDLIDGVTDDIITAIDDATGVPITIEFDPTQDWDPTIEKEDDTDLPDEDDKTPVVPDELIPVDYDIEPLTFDLTGVFPFCIPWDIKDMLSKLNASPVAPSYTVNWHIPIVNENLVFTVDLSPYDNVASVLRKMEVLAFCIGLALITRQTILRG